MIRKYYRRFIAVLLLLIAAVFILTQISNMKYVQSYISGKKIISLDMGVIKKYKRHPEKMKNKDDITLLYQVDRPGEDHVELSADSEVTQEFYAKDSHLRSVQLFFHNPDYYTAKGRVRVNVTDSSGKTVATSFLDAGLVTNKTRTCFDFTRKDSSVANQNSITKKTGSTKTGDYIKDGIKIKKGEKYTFHIINEDVETESEFGIYLTKENEKGARLTIDGKKHDGALFAGISYYHFTYMVVILLEIAFLIMIILILIPWGRIFGEPDRDGDEQKLKEGPVVTAGTKKSLLSDPELLLQRVLFILTPFVCYYMVFKIADYKLSEMLKFMMSLRGMLNLALILTVFLIIYLVFNSLKYASLLTTVLTFVFAITNYALIQFRGSPLVVTDLTSIGTAMDVAGNYEIMFNKASIWVISAFVLFIAPLICVNRRKSLSLKGRLVVLLVIAALGAALKVTCFNIGFTRSHGIYISGFRPTVDYERKGYPLAFAVTANTSTIRKPEGYSAEEVKKIAAKYTSDETEEKAVVSEKTPNIIVVMNEAFSDLSVIGEFETSGPYMPYFDSLKEDTVKGWLHTSIFGGSTANTEFEFLTGSSVEFFPFHAVPYNTNIRRETPSFTTRLKAQGYGGNIAFHPGKADSYNRNKVYPFLGFDRHISLEDLEDPDMLRSFVSDKGDFDEVISEYEEFRKDAGPKGAPFFMFNVTIQNHSGFGLSTGAVEKELTITDGELQFDQTEQYLNLIKKTDNALKDLLEYYKSKKEPTVVVMFGDHQPRVDEELYQVLQGRTKGKLSDLEKQELKYQVPFMIWANYDIKEEKDIHMSANYLGSFVLETIGARMSGFDKYLMDMRKEMPVISYICMTDTKGKLYDTNFPEKAPKEMRKLKDQYDMVQYNLIIDKNDRVDEFYELSDNG